MRILIVLTLTLLNIVTQPVESAAQPAEARQLQAFTASDYYKDVLNHTFEAIPEPIFRRCSTLVSTGSRVTILKPVSFGTDGRPNAGLWRQDFPVSGCGNDTVLHLYFTAGADEKIRALIGVPGTTRGDLTLQRDALMYAKIGATHVVKDCKTFYVKNTKFEAFGLVKPATSDPGPAARFRPWWETWTLVGCDRTVDVPIDFVPDAKGTTIIQPGGAVGR